jgi:hypothetical protein
MGRKLIVGMLAVALVGAGATPQAEAGKAKPRRGVFGTINGKAFKAKNIDGPTDGCVNGIYDVPNGIIVFGALECRGRRHRQGSVKKNYKTLVMGCTRFDQNLDTSVFPFELPCGSSAYAETKTGRFGTPLSTTTWGANTDFTNPVLPTSNVRMRVDGFDGTNLRGAIYGVFELPLGGAATPPAQISGEVTFDFPFRIE